MTVLDYNTRASRQLLAIAARRIILQQTGFVGDLARSLQNDRERALELLEALAVLGIVQRPVDGAVAWPVLVRAERAEEIYKSILAGPDGASL
jgi:hypothetical protein